MLLKLRLILTSTAIAILFIEASSLGLTNKIVTIVQAQCCCPNTSCGNGCIIWGQQQCGSTCGYCPGASCSGSCGGSPPPPPSNPPPTPTFTLPSCISSGSNGSTVTVSWAAVTPAVSIVDVIDDPITSGTDSCGNPNYANYRNITGVSTTSVHLGQESPSFQGSTYCPYSAGEPNCIYPAYGPGQAWGARLYNGVCPESYAKTILPVDCAAPSNLTAANTCNNTNQTTYLHLSWGGVNGATSYNIKRFTCSGTSCSSLSGEVDSSATSTAYDDTGVALGTTYQYQVYPYNVDGNGPYYGSTNVTVSNACYVACSSPPTSSYCSDQTYTDSHGYSCSGSASCTPGGISCSGNSSSTTISWNPVGAATYYSVTRNDGGFSAQPSSTSTSDSTLQNNTPYTYKVAPCDSAGCSNQTSSIQTATCDSQTPNITFINPPSGTCYTNTNDANSWNNTQPLYMNVVDLPPSGGISTTNPPYFRFYNTQTGGVTTFNATAASGTYQGQSYDYQANIPASSLTVGSYYTITALAQDNATPTAHTGNSATSKQFFFNSVCSAPYIQTQGGDVHSNTQINVQGGP